MRHIWNVMQRPANLDDIRLEKVSPLYRPGGVRFHPAPAAWKFTKGFWRKMVQFPTYTVTNYDYQLLTRMFEE